MKKYFQIILAFFLLVFLSNCGTASKLEKPIKTGKKSVLNSQSYVRVIPMRDFFRNPKKVSYKLSPDGIHLAFMKPWKNRLNVYVVKIGEKTEKRLTSATKRDLGGYFWANNSRIAYVQDTGGDENFRLYAVDIDGGNFKELTPFEKVKVRIVDDLKHNDNEMLISMNKRNARVFDVYRININTGEMNMIAKNPGNIAGWDTDHDGKLRLAFQTDGVNHSILYRDTEKDPFKALITISFKDTFSPLFFTYDNKNLYIASNLNRDKAAIYEYNIKKKQIVRLIYENPEVDVTRLIRSDKRKVITGVVYTTDKTRYHFFDENRKSLQKTLENLLPNKEVAVVSMSKDEQKVMLIAYTDKTMGTYYLYNRGNKTFTKLTDISPWLHENEMSSMKPITYKSRDGLTIHGYLTLPNGLEPHNLPVVVNPHGGPWYRDRWGFNPEIQFLSNRGYAVLQMNFRGSTGYGRKFWTLGFKQWGRKMQNDISDGVKWLIKKGIADPKRIGIYGASYGGYATLAGLTFTPDLYACGVDYVGVSSIFSLLKSLPPYWLIGLQMNYEMIGDPDKDKDLLRAISPLYHVDKIKAPLFIAQGANDPRVPIKESNQIVAALKKRGINVPYMVKKNEGHGFRNEENRFDFYRAMEKFLAKYLGGRVEKIAP